MVRIGVHCFSHSDRYLPRDCIAAVKLCHFMLSLYLYTIPVYHLNIHQPHGIFISLFSYVCTKCTKMKQNLYEESMVASTRGGTLMVPLLRVHGEGRGAPPHFAALINKSLQAASQ